MGSFLLADSFSDATDFNLGCSIGDRSNLFLFAVVRRLAMLLWFGVTHLLGIVVLVIVLYLCLCFTRAASILSTLYTCSFFTKSLLTLSLTLSFCIVFIRSLTFLEALNFFSKSLICRASFFIRSGNLPSMGNDYILFIYCSVSSNPSLIEFHLMSIIYSCRALSNFS